MSSANQEDAMEIVQPEPEKQPVANDANAAPAQPQEQPSENAAAQLAAPQQSNNEKAQEEQKLIELKIKDINRDIHAVLQGSHQEFTWRFKKLEQIRDEKVATAQRYKDLQTKLIARVCDGEIDQAKKDFEQEVNNLRERMINLLMDKQKKLEEEKLDVPINFSDEYLSAPSSGSRKLRRRQKDAEQVAAKPPINYISYETYQKKRKVPVNVNFTLGSDEINDDLSQIVKGSRNAKW